MKAGRAVADTGGEAAADVAHEIGFELMGNGPVHQLRAHEHFHDGFAFGVVEHRLAEGELPFGTHTGLHGTIDSANGFGPAGRDRAVDRETNGQGGKHILLAHDRLPPAQQGVHEARDEIALSHPRIAVGNLLGRPPRVARGIAQGVRQSILKGGFGAIDREPMEVGIDAAEIGGDLADRAVGEAQQAHRQIVALKRAPGGRLARALPYPLTSTTSDPTSQSSRSIMWMPPPSMTE